MKTFTLDMGPTALRALWQTGHIDADDLPEIAVEFLLAGADSQALREMAGLIRPTCEDAGPVLTRVLRDLGAPSLDDDMAGRIAARVTAARALAGTLSPYHAAVVLAGLCRICDYPPDLSWFIGAIDEWDYAPHERPAIAAEILDACQRLVAAPDDSLAPPAPPAGSG